METMDGGIVKIDGEAKGGCIKDGDIVNIDVNDTIYSTEVAGGKWSLEIPSSAILTKQIVTAEVVSMNNDAVEFTTTAELEFPTSNIKSGFALKDLATGAALAIALAGSNPPPPAPPPASPASTEDGLHYQIFFCKMYGITLTEEEIKSMIEAIQQLNNTLYEMHTGKADAIYPVLGMGEKPAPGAAREGDIVDKNMVDMISTVITGKKFADMDLEKEGGETGEYDSSLNGRIHKTTEMMSGMMVGLFTEDEIKEKIISLDKNKPQTMNDSAERITRAIQALVLSFVYADHKGDIKMAELRREDFPDWISVEFLEQLQDAYEKFSGDFTHNLRDLDDLPDDNHPFGDLFGAK